MYTEVLKRLPKHLHGFIVDQHYEQYTPVDHAVWRYVMRLNKHFLSIHAHESYIEGLKKTGISIERIPEISEMNKILSRIGWLAACVDGFIPPTAFMEFQAYKVLVIAADIRQSKHIDYTPAPDILHEAAGHAPIIADKAYADYLQLFGEIGKKAISSARDYELYEAIRHLSIVKENRDSTAEEIHEAEELLENIQTSMGPMSEMARLRNLHWWTVEYGLIGSLEHPKIYGAGLLSSIGESISCLKDQVKKLPYTLNAADQAFDITTQQPQLYVTPDFNHLSKVLEAFADQMAFRKGGFEALKKALDSNAVATMVYNSGLQISGVLQEILTDHMKQPAYLRTVGPTMLSENDRMLKGHDKDYHADGFGSPVGKLKSGLCIPDQPDIGKKILLDFENGVQVNGLLTKVLHNHTGQPMLLTFDQCRVSLADRTLFDPAWGAFDMAVGEQILSVFAGPADPAGFGLTYEVPKEHTPKPHYTAEQKHLHSLYNMVREIREQKISLDNLESVFNIVKQDYSDDYLLVLEIYELLKTRNEMFDLQESVLAYLTQKQAESTWLLKILSDGLALLD